jgi:hypothetical protein
MIFSLEIDQKSLFLGRNEAHAEARGVFSDIGLSQVSLIGAFYSTPESKTLIRGPRFLNFGPHSI